MARKQKPLNLDFLSGAKDFTTPVVPATRSVLSTILALNKDDAERAILVEIDRLHDNPYQPRLKTDESNLKELSQVISSQGFQGVLVARPHAEMIGHYQITAGHRRREASKQAGLSMLPVVVKELSDEEMVGLAITENIQREDLTPLEEGRIFLLMSEEMDYTHEQIAREIGKNRGYVENRLRVARAPEDIQDLVAQKPDSLRAVSNLIKVSDPDRRKEAIELLKAGELTADDLTAYLADPVPGPLPQQRAIPTGFTAQEGKLETDDGATSTYSKKSFVSEKVSNPAKVLDTPPPPSLTLERVGASKLATVLRTLQQFQGNVEQRLSMTELERERLTEIEILVKELIKKHYKAGSKESKN